MVKIKLSREKDFPILRFLWKWKMATTAMIGRFFYGSPRAEGAYRRLKRLQSAGFVQCKGDLSGNKYVWVPTQKGFQAIRSELPSLKEEGFKSENMSHDLLTNLVHLGAWAYGIPGNCEVFTEQQLRRYQVSDYPEWIPASVTHRPDGYWKIPAGEQSKTIALEVEVSRKMESNYFAIGEFYRGWKEVFQVVWIVNSQKDSLIQKLSDGSETQDNFHNLVSLDSFLSLGWQAPVFSGDAKGQSLENILFHQPSTGTPLVDDWWKLDTSKSPHKSNSYQYFELGDFRY